MSEVLKICKNFRNKNYDDFPDLIAMFKEGRDLREIKIKFGAMQIMVARSVYKGETGNLNLIMHASYYGGANCFLATVYNISHYKREEGLSVEIFMDTSLFGKIAVDKIRFKSKTRCLTRARHLLWAERFDYISNNIYVITGNFYRDMVPRAAIFWFLKKKGLPRFICREIIFWIV